jgi:hypothetical protein
MVPECVTVFIYESSNCFTKKQSLQSYADDLKSIGRYSTVSLSYRQILYRLHRFDRFLPSEEISSFGDCNAELAVQSVRLQSDEPKNLRTSLSILSGRSL